MKKYLFLILMFILLLSVSLAEAKGKTRSLKPKNAKKNIPITISGKTRRYYPLSTEKPSILSIKGPGKLRVISRSCFIPKEEDKVKYDIIYIIDGGKEKKYKARGVKRSKQATYKDGSLGVPGLLKDFEIELGRGYHTLEFRLDKETPPVALRFIFTPTKKKKQDWLSLSPLSPSEPVNLITNEEITHYYRFSKNKPLQVEIIGPTELRVLTRIEFAYDMKGRVNYRIQIRRKDKVVNTYQLSSRRSEITTYENNGKLVAGKAREFVINVPKGQQKYDIMLLDKNKSALARFMFPKKDVKLEK